MTARRHTVVMLTTSYPRFPGDGVGAFMEPIAQGIAARGHRVHIVAPWHPRIRRSDTPTLQFHFYRYAPVAALNVFGYAGALKADVSLRASAYLAAPLALATGWRAARRASRSIGQGGSRHAATTSPSGRSGSAPTARGCPWSRTASTTRASDLTHRPALACAPRMAYLTTPPSSSPPVGLCERRASNTWWMRWASWRPTGRG